MLLLDEIEKAHSDIYNILLQIMDYGTLTDNNGRKADFRNVIVIMTTNAGAREMTADIDPSNLNLCPKAVEKTFTPEFRNRLDAIIHFKPLTPDLIARVVDKFAGQLDERLAAKKVMLDLNDDARAWIAEKGYDAKMGARPINKLIHKEIYEKLVDEILFGKLVKGGTVKVSVAKEELKLSIKPLK